MLCLIITNALLEYGDSDVVTKGKNPHTPLIFKWVLAQIKYVHTR